MLIPGVRSLSLLRTRIIGRHFDWLHGVHTCGEEEPADLTVIGNNVAHAIRYAPTTPRVGRHMLANRPVEDVSSYTFIDMGSGKGRMLLLAAELPFRKIIGVEFATELHRVAEANVRSYRNPRQVCFALQPLNADAAEFAFPPEPLFIYFFYPFNRNVMEPVIRNLDRSLEECPRNAIVVYRNPVFSDVIEASRHLRLLDRRTYFGNAYDVYVK